jgi:hypothetical protein
VRLPEQQQQLRATCNGYKERLGTCEARLSSVREQLRLPLSLALTLTLTLTLTLDLLQPLALALALDLLLPLALPLPLALALPLPLALAVAPRPDQVRPNPNQVREQLGQHVRALNQLRCDPRQRERRRLMAQQLLQAKVLAP